MKKNLLIGIDEVGRSSVIGPFVIAGVLADEDIIEAWEEIGVTDSKQIGNRNKIKELSEYIKSTALAYNIQIADAQEVDKYVSVGQYDVLERDRARKIICTIGRYDCTVLLDGANIFNKKFLDEFRNSRYAFDAKAYKSADCLYIVVGAASIIAKNMRDQIVDEIVNRYGKTLNLEIKGRGELNKGTIKFLKTWYEKYGYFPIETRLSFKPFRTGSIFEQFKELL